MEEYLSHFENTRSTCFITYKKFLGLRPRKVVYNRIYRFLTDVNLLYNKQFGFRTNHSTSMALIQLVNNIASSIDDKETTVGVFLDFSKAFDTIDHHILLNKLDRYAIRGPALEWIASYLTNRKQFVQFGFFFRNLNQ